MEQLTIDPKLITLRDLQPSDVKYILDYWYRSPPGFVEARGVDLAKLPLEVDMRKSLEDRITANQSLSISKMVALVFTYGGEAIGFHTMFPLTEGDSGVFHAHIWKPEMRGRGIGMHTYPRACRIYFDRFQLKRILFKTPVQNTSAIRVKEKLGIRTIGEELIGFGIVKDGTRARVFELMPDELLQLAIPPHYP
jgi:RimJ/RimL family protein N-acetyltransferase